MTGGLTEDEQGGFRAGKWCVDQAFTLKQVVEKAQEKKRSVCGFYRLEKAYDRVNRKAFVAGVKHV